MADVNDPHNFEGQFEAHVERLENSDHPNAVPASEEDRRALKRFIAHRRQNVQKSTLIGDLGCLYNCIYAGETLVEMTYDDYEILMFDLAEGNRHKDSDLSDGTIRNYRKALKQFHRHQGNDWYTEIDVGSPIERDLDPDEFFTADEIEDLLDACRNTRDKAILAVFADSLLRVGALASLRIKDIEFVGGAAKLRINQDALGTKGAEGPFPSTWSRGYIGNWLESHPDTSDPDNPLWVPLQEDDVDRYSAFSPSHIRNSILKRVCRRAGYDEDRMQPHNFRDRGATNMRLSGDHGESEIEHRLGWVKGSKMIGKYDHVEREQKCDQILADQGFIDAPDDADGVTLSNCPQCGLAVGDIQGSFCPSCGGAVGSEARERRSEVEGDAFDHAADPDTGDAIVISRDALDEYPELVDALVDRDIT